MAKLKSKASDEREKIVQTALNRAGDLLFESYAKEDFSDLDWWIAKNNEVVGVAEFKGRTCNSTQFATIFLSVRKYEKLKSTSEMFKVKPLMVYCFADGLIYTIDIREVKPEWLSEVRRTKARASGNVGANDREPAYEVPLKNMQLVGQLTPDELVRYNKLGDKL